MEFSWYCCAPFVSAPVYFGYPRLTSDIYFLSMNFLRRKESWAGHSEWRPVSYNLSLVRGYVCPEMEKGWLLGRSPSFPCALGEASVKGITLCQRSSVSVAWLVMPIHWIRDEHTITVYNSTKPKSYCRNTATNAQNRQNHSFGQL